LLRGEKEKQDRRGRAQLIEGIRVYNDVIGAVARTFKHYRRLAGI